MAPKCPDLMPYEMKKEVYNLIHTEFLSIEALNFYSVIDLPVEGIWYHNQNIEWANYSNLTRI